MTTPRPVPEMAQALAALGEVAVWELWGPGDPAALRPEEEPLVSDAVEGRVVQFAAGRQCARAAMAALGVEPMGLGRGTGRSAAWPPTLWGSISHTDGYAAAVVGRRERCAGPLGVDAEQVGRVEDNLHRRLFLPDERSWLIDVGGDPDGDGDPRDGGIRAQAATELFGLKECLYKAQFPLTGAWVGFHDVHIGGPKASDFDRPIRTWYLTPATDLPALAAVDWPCRGWSTLRAAPGSEGDGERSNAARAPDAAAADEGGPTATTDRPAVAGVALTVVAAAPRR
ncbi:MAG: 4'-phosphopantetheinyl transferase superfamily protein [Actinomycetota bacterium]